MYFWSFTGMKMSSMEETPSHVNAIGYIPPYTSLHNQVSRLILWLVPALAHELIHKITNCICPSLMISSLSDRPSASFSGTWLYAFSGEEGLEGLLTTRTTTSSSSTSPWATCRSAVWSVPLLVTVQQGLAWVTRRKW